MGVGGLENPWLIHKYQYFLSDVPLTVTLLAIQISRGNSRSDFGPSSLGVKPTLLFEGIIYRPC